MTDPPAERIVDVTAVHGTLTVASAPQAPAELLELKTITGWIEQARKRQNRGGVPAAG